MSDASEAIATLPFVRNRPDGKGREFWHVTATGKHDVDFSLGRGYAILEVDSRSNPRALLLGAQRVGPPQGLALCRERLPAGPS
jgi:hypothetical protein